MLKKVYQTVVSDVLGNCFQAALATLFSRTLDDTINVIDYPETEWHLPFHKWCKSIGYEWEGCIFVVGTGREPYDELKFLSEPHAIDGHYIASVPSKNFEGITHAVIVGVDGIVAHDPNPKKQWLGVDVVASGDINYIYLFQDITVDDSKGEE